MPDSLPTLPQDAAEALAKAALLEDPFSTQVLLAAGSPPETLDPLFDLGLLEENSPNEACFVSDATRDAALATLSWSGKRKLSLALAQTCQTLGQDPALVARLFLQAHHHSESRKHFAAAAEKACRRHDYREALALMQSAFEIWPADQEPEERREALRELCRCASTCSDHVTARLGLSQLLDSLPPDSSAGERLELMRQLAQAAFASGDRVGARELLAEAAAYAEKAGLTNETAYLWRSLAQAQGDALRVQDALVTLDKARRAAVANKDHALLSDCLAYAAVLTAQLGRIREARQLLEQGLAIAIDHDLPDQITNAYRRQANVNEYAANYEAYRDTELAALDRCRALDQHGGTQACLSCVSYAFFRLGQFDQSLDAIREAVDELGVEGELRAGALAVRACIHTLRNGDAKANTELDEAIDHCRIHNGRVFEFYALWTKGANATLQTESDLARETFDALIAFWRETDDRKDVAPGLLCAATFFSQENDAERLSLCIDILNTIRSASEAAEPGYAFLAASAEDAWTRGQAEEAIARLQEASDGYNTLHLRFEEAWTLWRLGFIQSQAGFPAEASASWKKALNIAQRLALKPLSRAISRDRRQATRDSEDPVPLTPRQREIARLIAAGRTNKEAAAELDISPRTVEMHVAALIERLGCRSRAEAAAKASELGLLR